MWIARSLKCVTILSCNVMLELYMSVVAVLQNVGSAEDIDKGMRLGTNQPMGPLRLADFIGE